MRHRTPTILATWALSIFLLHCGAGGGGDQGEEEGAGIDGEEQVTNGPTLNTSGGSNGNQNAATSGSGGSGGSSSSSTGGTGGSGGSGGSSSTGGSSAGGTGGTSATGGSSSSSGGSSSAGGSSSSGGATASGGSGSGGSGGSGQATNTSRASYPGGCTPTSSHLGTGNILCDFQFAGFGPRNVQTGLATEAGPYSPHSMQEVRSTTNTRYAYVHMAATWCGNCHAVMQEITTKYKANPAYAAKGVVVSLVNDGPNETWLRNSWVNGFQMPFTDGTNGPGCPANFVPKIGNDVDSCYVVDLDSMKVVCSGTNRATSLDCFAQFEKLIGI